MSTPANPVIDLTDESEDARQAEVLDARLARELRDEEVARELQAQDMADGDWDGPLGDAYASWAVSGKNAPRSSAAAAAASAPSLPTPTINLPPPSSLVQNLIDRHFRAHEPEQSEKEPKRGRENHEQPDKRSIRHKPDAASSAAAAAAASPPNQDMDFDGAGPADAGEDEQFDDEDIPPQDFVDDGAQLIPDEALVAALDVITSEDDTISPEDAGELVVGACEAYLTHPENYTPHPPATPATTSPSPAPATGPPSPLTSIPLPAAHKRTFGSRTKPFDGNAWIRRTGKREVRREAREAGKDEARRYGTDQTTAEWKEEAKPLGFPPGQLMFVIWEVYPYWWKHRMIKGKSDPKYWKYGLFKGDSELYELVPMDYVAFLERLLEPHRAAHKRHWMTHQSTTHPPCKIPFTYGTVNYHTSMDALLAALKRKRQLLEGGGSVEGAQSTDIDDTEEAQEDLPQLAEEDLAQLTTRGKNQLATIKAALRVIKTQRKEPPLKNTGCSHGSARDRVHMEHQRNKKRCQKDFYWHTPSGKLEAIRDALVSKYKHVIGKCCK